MDQTRSCIRPAVITGETLTAPVSLPISLRCAVLCCALLCSARRLRARCILHPADGFHGINTRYRGGLTLLSSDRSSYSAVMPRFDGDGMVHAVRIKDGTVTYTNKFVRTQRFMKEKELGYPAYAKVLDDEHCKAYSHLIAHGTVLNEHISANHSDMLCCSSET